MFKPRGHYAKSVELTRYFQAMTWLARIDLRCLPEKPQPSQHQMSIAALISMALISGMFIYSTSQCNANCYLDKQLKATWTTFDSILTAYVGITDSMTPKVMSEIVINQIGIKTIDELLKQSPDQVGKSIFDKVLASQVGIQMIHSHMRLGKPYLQLNDRI